MNIDNLTIKEAREIAAIFQAQSKTSDDSHWEVGSNYLIRTVTMIQCGKLEKVTDKELVLSGASWIADTGRFSAALQTGDFNEVEMFSSDSPAIVGRGAIIDAQKVSFSLPQETK